MTSIITIGFSRPKDKMLPIGSWLIRLYQRTSYSHVYLKFYSKSLDRVLIYEAVGGGVRFVSQQVWNNKAKEVAEVSLDISGDNYKTLLQYCVDYAGVKYGVLQNIGLVISGVLRLKHNLFTSGVNCSEIVAQILQLEGYTFNKNLNLVTPKDIELILSSKPPGYKSRF